MPEYKQFTAKPIKGIDQEDWGKWTVHKSNVKEANYSKNNYLRFKPDLVYELAKPFTTTQSMIDYKGDNEEQINSAGHLISHTFERPEWFVEIRKNNSETDDECIEILSKVSTTEEIYSNKNYLRLLHRLWLHNGKEDVKKMLSHLSWKRMLWTDDMIYNVISNYNTIVEIRNGKKDKSLLTRLQVDKGEKYPKSYALYLTMKTKNGGEGKRKKRGKYKLKK